MKNIFATLLAGTKSIIKQRILQFALSPLPPPPHPAEKLDQLKK
jgi:hypothetical protein